MVLHTYNDLSLPRFQDIFSAMKSCLANILVQFVVVGCYGNEFENLR